MKVHHPTCELEQTYFWPLPVRVDGLNIQIKGLHLTALNRRKIQSYAGICSCHGPTMHRLP